MLRPFQAVEDIMDAKSVLKTDLQSPTPLAASSLEQALQKRGEAATRV